MVLGYRQDGKLMRDHHSQAEAKVEHHYPEVATAVRAVLDEESTVPAFHELLQQLMAGKGRVLSREGTARWPAFVLEPCRVLEGNLDAAVWAAAAVEFTAAAAEVVDDLVDDEWSEETVTQARAINASAGLIWLAQRSTAHLVGCLGSERAWRINDLLARGYLDACAGEDLDLLLEAPTKVTEELAHEMTRRKSGSLVAMACQVGAAVATDDLGLIETLGQFGCHVGLAAQLLNDLAGINSENATRGSDLRRKKKTLPVTYAIRCAQEEGMERLLAWYQGMPDGDITTEQDIASMIRELGGLHYGWVVADTHRREALALLRALAHATGRNEVHQLRQLVPVAHSQPA
ncbi:MAG: polyprenyl synthetase family protein [Ktedonobacterales bacterium]